ncbi:hypothetical protein FNU76_01110 [Chitinimonas arctica]|uniref:Uncharacterized protein n=1 Tax=Chitinimonas arctica TaxID=2594795 RepID=A0A516SA81_9NEIS|nr:hypothetical protein [Chitinimonas arctica]QDQ25059.1 hypothetical protein FNU76_01110 [Chitinimonas arctica]
MKTSPIESPSSSSSFGGTLVGEIAPVNKVNTLQSDSTLEVDGDPPLEALRSSSFFVDSHQLMPHEPDLRKISFEEVAIEEVEDLDADNEINQLSETSFKEVEDSDADGEVNQLSNGESNQINHSEAAQNADKKNGFFDRVIDSFLSFVRTLFCSGSRKRPQLGMDIPTNTNRTNGVPHDHYKPQVGSPASVPSKEKFNNLKPNTGLNKEAAAIADAAVSMISAKGKNDKVWKDGTANSRTFESGTNTLENVYGAFRLKLNTDSNVFFVHTTDNSSPAAASGNNATPAIATVVSLNTKKTANQTGDVADAGKLLGFMLNEVSKMLGKKRPTSAEIKHAIASMFKGFDETDKSHMLRSVSFSAITFYTDSSGSVHCLTVASRYGSIKDTRKSLPDSVWLNAFKVDDSPTGPSVTHRLSSPSDQEDNVTEAFQPIDSGNGSTNPLLNQ